MSQISSDEKIFSSNFKYFLFPQPFMIISHEGERYRPDFYCPENGSIYEITRNNAYNHIGNGHLGCAISVAPVFIVTLQPQQMLISISKYVHEGWSSSPRHITVSPEKEQLLLNAIKKYKEKGGNKNLISYLEQRCDREWIY